MHIMSRVDPAGDNFLLLGVTFDTKLLFQEAITSCCSDAHWRLSSLLKTRRFFTDRDLVLHYKAHVLSYLEYRTPVFTHCSDSSLRALDVIQNRLLEIISISDLEAFRHLNLAPLGLRRDISNLGIIYRAVIGSGPKPLHKFFIQSQVTSRVSPRRLFNRYSLADPYRPLNRDYINRSVLGYIGIFNLLPDAIFVDARTDHSASIKVFQSNLVCFVKDCTEMNA